MKPTHVCLLFIFLPLSIAWAQTPPERVPLWNGHAPIGNDQFAQEDAFLTVHQASKPAGPAIVICPGGGYGGLVVGAEGHGIANWLNQNGITGAVLEYRLPKGRPYVPLLDAQQAIRYLRLNATKFGIRQDRIGIMGFSAGGHLASTAATHFDRGNQNASNELARQSCRPDFAILVYPVITMDTQTHRGSRTNLLGSEPSEELLTLFSNEKQVTSDTPPTYLAHALDDKPVPPENSRAFYNALKMHGVAPSIWSYRQVVTVSMVTKGRCGRLGSVVH